MEDYHVDRPGVEVGRPMKLTGTNNPIGLIVSQQNSFDDCSLTEAISDNVFFSSLFKLPHQRYLNLDDVLARSIGLWPT